jgi:hypothetical protein
MQPRMATSCSIALLVGCALSSAPLDARADPQASVGLTIGAAGAGLERKIWDTTALHLGLHGDVIFGRNQVSDLGGGPYLEVLTNGFDEIQFGGGLSAVFPVLPSVPLVVSFGAYGRKGPEPFPVEPGLAGAVFFGSRSYNFHANYVMAAGIIGQMRYGLGPSKETSIIVGAQIDLVILSLPVLFLINAARGGSRDTDPVPK